MSESPARVFTIPPSAPFLPTLAQAIADGRLIPGFPAKGDPLALADATIFLPTRRAVRVFGEALVEALGTDALILPRVLPLGDVDEDEIAFEREGADLPDAISPTARRIVLARLVQQWADSSARDRREPPLETAPVAALALADELARVLDDLTIEGVQLEALDKIIPDHLDEYWNVSRDFLKIVQRAWPDILKERGLADPTARREMLLQREAERLREGAGGPVIAAGSTGSLPSVAHLLRIIAQRKDGAVVLPGLDQILDEQSFNGIGEAEADSAQAHPQFGLQRLLQELGIKRADVVSLATPPMPARERLLSEAFVPAETTDRWGKAAQDPLALEGLTIVEAADPREEALAIAVSLREALKQKLSHVALITPDRALARRVAAELTRWGIAADDSAGTPLSESESGRFARLVAETAASEFAPLPLIAFLRHPRSRFAADPGVDVLEAGVLRGLRPARGVNGLVRAIETARIERHHPNEAKAKLSPEDWDRARALCEDLRVALDPLCALSAARPLNEIVRAHRAALQGAGLDLDNPASPDAEKLAEMLEEMASAPAGPFVFTLRDYADAFPQLIAGGTLRMPFDPGAAIRILGPIEARLVTFDRAVLGGLNEGTWPAGARTDAFLNRPMRRDLHLNLPERRIGLSAHDFVQLLGAREVVVTRARRQSGAETVASRSWQRLAAVAAESAWKAALARGDTLLTYARALDQPRGAALPIKPPAPKPPVAARPQRLAVTDVEHLVRDPYTIYAKHILKLFPLEEIDADPGAAERGSVLHHALAHFVRQFPGALPKDALANLIKAGEHAFEPYRDFPGATAVWWPRFLRVAEWFIGAEQKRRGNIESIKAEIRGTLSFEADGFSFTLSATADRIELQRDKSAAILDYKTGERPTLAQAITGLAPQLPLEAAIARAGGFDSVPKDAPIKDIGVFQLSGGNPPGKFFSLDPSLAKGTGKKLPDKYKIDNCDDLADFALARLKALIAYYAKEDTPYLSVPRPKWKKRYGNYDHLARIKEWTESGGEE
jgi:ATP-dependent helicase/nuclease subunit B